MFWVFPRRNRTCATRVQWNLKMTEQRTSRYHIIARALLVVVIMLSQCLIWWPAAKTAVSAPDEFPGTSSRERLPWRRVWLGFGRYRGPATIESGGGGRAVVPHDRDSSQQRCDSTGAPARVGRSVSAQPGIVATSHPGGSGGNGSCWSRGNFTKRPAYRQTLPARRGHLVTKTGTQRP